MLSVVSFLFYIRKLSISGYYHKLSCPVMFPVPGFCLGHWNVKFYFCFLTGAPALVSFTNVLSSLQCEEKSMENPQERVLMGLSYLWEKCYSFLRH